MYPHVIFISKLHEDKLRAEELLRPLLNDLQAINHSVRVNYVIADLPQKAVLTCFRGHAGN